MGTSKSGTVNGYNGYKIEDDLLRYIFVGTDRVIQPGVNGTLIETVFSWTTKYVNRRYRATTAVNANPIYLYADLFQPIGVISQITLPAQAGSRQFTFTYNAADSPPGGYTYGWGELKSISLPGGAAADYAYSLDGNGSIELQGFNIIANSAQSRQLSYQTEYDGQTVSATPEVTTYAAAQGAGSSTSPDGRVQFQYSAVGGELNGYVYRTTQTVASMPNGGSMTERIWVAKRPSGTGPDIQIEPIVKTEFTSIPDASGARVKKYNQTTGETTIFVYDAGGALAAEYSTAAPPANPTTSYLTTDHLGSPRVITDSTGNVISRRDFMPFGEELGAGVGPRTTGLKYSGTDNVRQRFTGYEKDTESGLDFAEARMYENKHGRFTAPDPLLASVRAGDPQTFNRYTYTGNNPINFIASGLRYVRF